MISLVFLRNITLWFKNRILTFLSKIKKFVERNFYKTLTVLRLSSTLPKKKSQDTIEIYIEREKEGREKFSIWKMIFIIFSFDLIFTYYVIRNKFWPSFFKKTEKNIWCVFHIPVWGQYTEIFLSFLQKNLLSSCNKSFSQKHKIQILFSCTKDEKKIIENDKNFKKLKKFYKVKFHIWPSFLIDVVKDKLFPGYDPRYLILATMQHYALVYAQKNDSALIPFHPDIMIEKDFFSKIDQIKNKGKDVILSSPFRSDLPKIRDFLSKMKKKDHISLSGQEIVDIQCKFIHPVSLDRIVAPNKKFMSLTPQLIFKEGNSLVVKAFTWTPIFISKALVKTWKKNFVSPIDDKITFLAEEHRSKVFFIQNASDLGMCELSDPKPVEPTYLRNNLKLETLLFKKFAGFSTNDLFFFQQKLRYCPNFKMNMEFASVDVDDLNTKVLDLFNKKGKA